MATLTHQDTQRRPGRLRPGCWDWFIYGGWRGEPARPVPAVSCPQCGRLFCLAGHRVGAGGQISPSVVCPDCPWHVMARLDGA